MSFGGNYLHFVKETVKPMKLRYLAYDKARRRNLTKSATNELYEFIRSSPSMKWLQFINRCCFDEIGCHCQAVVSHNLSIFILLLSLDRMAARNCFSQRWRPRWVKRIFALVAAGLVFANISMKTSSSSETDAAGLCTWIASLYLRWPEAKIFTAANFVLKLSTEFKY